MWVGTPLISLDPLSITIVDLNKPKIIGNGGELSGLEYLPTKTEKVKYLQNTAMRTSHLFGPFQQHYIISKQAQDHRKWWRIEWPGVFTYQNRKSKIST